MQEKLTAKKLGIILLLVLTLLPSKIHAQGTNAGFVPGNIWYSKDPFEEGDKIKIYTLIFNPDDRELRGSVIFLDNSVFLGRKEFTAPPKGVKDVSIDWMVTTGDHNIFAKIESSRFLSSNGKYEEVYLAGNETSKSTRTVSKKVIAKLSDTFSPDTHGKALNIDGAVENAGNAVVDSVKNNTPNFITQPVIKVTNVVETLRQNLGTATEKKRGEVKAQIKAYNTNSAKISADSKENTSAGATTSNLIKPFKYTELFALALFSTTFNNKFIFYAVLILIIFFLLRYIVKRVR